MNFHQHLLLISVYFFLLPAVNIASVLVSPPFPSSNQPEYNTWSDHPDESLTEIASAPSPEDAGGSAASSDQQLAMELGGGSEEVILCCSNSGTDSELACREGTYFSSLWVSVK